MSEIDGEQGPSPAWGLVVTASAGHSVNDGMLRPASAADPEAHDKIWSRARDVKKSLEARSPSGH